MGPVSCSASYTMKLATTPVSSIAPLSMPQYNSRCYQYIAKLQPTAKRLATSLYNPLKKNESCFRKKHLAHVCYGYEHNAPSSLVHLSSTDHNNCYSTIKTLLCPRIGGLAKLASSSSVLPYYTRGFWDTLPHVGVGA